MIDLRKLIDKYGIYVLFIILFLFIFNVQRYSYNNVVNNYKEEIILNKSLTDTIKIYKDKNDNLIYEKNVIQTELSNLKKKKDDLTDNQKLLLEKIMLLEKDKKILAASNMVMKITIDSLNNSDNYNNVDTINKSIQFLNKDEYFDLTILVDNVIPYNDSLDVKHYIQSLNIYNDMFISFNYDKNNKKPISFNVTNSNIYMNVNDIDSYVIPEINPNNIDDTKYKKFKTKLKEFNKYVYMGLGIGVGILVGSSF